MSLVRIQLFKITEMEVIVMNTETTIAPINEDLNVAKYEAINIKNLIYCIRGKQVMLDSDVAMLYHYETKKINQTVKRNIERFPEKFCFQFNENKNVGAAEYIRPNIFIIS